MQHEVLWRLGSLDGLQPRDQLGFVAGREAAGAGRPIHRRRVWTKLGSITLTVTPSTPISPAGARVNPITPAFDGESLLRADE